MTQARILIVEDDHAVVRDIQHQLERIGHTVVGMVTRGDDVLAVARSVKPTLVLIDIRLEGAMVGIAAAESLRAHHPVPVVFVTTYADEEIVRRATHAEPFGYLLRPFDDSQLRTTIEVALYKHAADERVRASERRYAVTLASIADAVIAVDASGRITFMNPVAKELTGWAGEDAVGRQLDEVYRIVDSDTDMVLQTSAEQVRHLRTTAGLAARTQLFARDARKFPVDDSIAPIFDDSGTFVGSVLAFRDTSQRRQAEEAEAQREMYARFELALRGSDVAVAEFDMADGVLENATVHSTNFLQRHGVKPEDMRTWKDAQQAWHPDDRERITTALRAHLAGGSGFLELEVRTATPVGYRMRIARGFAVRDAAGKAIRFIGCSMDITERRAIEEALRESEARYRNTFEYAPAGLVHTDCAAMSILRVNQTYLDMTGYTREEVLGPAGMAMLHPNDLPATLERFRKIAAAEVSSYEAQVRVKRKNGTWMWVRVSASLGRDGPDARPYLISLIEDISDRKRLETELQSAKEAAEASNRAKDEFLANVSHEIRTPMNAILGMTELVLDTHLEEGQRQSLRTVQSAASSLLGLINDLLDFSKIEAGKVTLALAEFGLRALLGDTMRALAMRAHRKGLELLCNVDPETPDGLVGDAGRLRQILINLVGNAIKFTEHGEVQVDVTVLRHTGEDVELQFAVRDTGIGIPDEKQSSIFRAFEQEDMSTTRRYGGTGLGLTIAASLVTMMGGLISVDSAQGRGSTFSFNVHLGWREQTAVRVPTGETLTGLRVLVVDDNAANREILERWLREWRMDPTAVRDGLAAMDALWHAVASRRPYALILLDARMPDTDGLSLAATIRERAELAGTRIILLTSGDHPNERHRLRQLRIDAQVLKPVPQEELFATIHDVMTRSAGGSVRIEPTSVQVATESAPLSGLPLRVLVAEDNLFNSELLHQLLARRGHAVRVVQDGRTALEYAKSGAFDLLLLDLHMPGLDGFQVLEALRDHERATGTHLPVIALTARARAEDRARCFAAGTDDFLPKPIRAVDLWSAIERATNGADAAYASTPRGPLVTPGVLIAAVGGSAAVLAVVREGLKTRLPSTRSAMSDALVAGDVRRLGETARSASSMFAAFSTELGAITSELEELVERGDLDAARVVFARLCMLAPELLRELDTITIE